MWYVGRDGVQSRAPRRRGEHGQLTNHPLPLVTGFSAEFDTDLGSGLLPKPQYVPERLTFLFTRCNSSNRSTVNSFGDTPLHVAVRNFNFDCIDALLVMRSRTDLANLDGHKPFELARGGDWDKDESKTALRNILDRRVVSLPLRAMGEREGVPSPGLFSHKFCYHTYLALTIQFHRSETLTY